MFFLYFIIKLLQYFKLLLKLNDKWCTIIPIDAIKIDKCER